MWKLVRTSFALLVVVSISVPAISAAELPILRLRKTSTALILVSRLQDPATASGWYPASPTWFGLGGKTGDRNHTEVLATYDDTALYVAFMNIDRSTAVYPQNTSTDLTLIDSNAIWIETPQGRRFCLLSTVDDRYPAQPRQASGEFPNVDGFTNRLSGWTNKGWFAGNLTMQQTTIIPWGTLGTSSPTQGSRWRVNFVNYNQTSTAGTASTMVRQTWAPGDETHPDQWGTLAFDEAAVTAPTVSPEATITMRPATGFGGEVTLRAGNYADTGNGWADEAVTQSNWNDWDPVDYTIKEYMQFDLSLIPPGRKIISATLRNYYRGNYNSGSTDQYLHVVRLANEFDPATVTMLTSPLPVENGFRRLVSTSEGGSRIDFDVTDVVKKAYEGGAHKAVLALAGSSGDTHNGKIWGVSYGRADWYESQRPRLVITFGKPGVTYAAPVKLGSLVSTSVATTASKNKLTNGTFRYGIVEGIANTTYWLDPGQVYVDGKNVAMMLKAGDVNPNTGNPALRIVCAVSWKSIHQTATGLVGGRSYTFSGWLKGSAPGVKSDVRLNFKDAAGTSLGSGQTVYSGSGNWEKLKLTKSAPAGTVICDVDVFNDTSGTGTYMLYSDFQLEEGTSATTYSETMGAYYPDYPRTDGTVVPTADNCIRTVKQMPVGSAVALADKVVTGVFEGFFYIQDPNHSACGIKVISAQAPMVGSGVSVSGILGMDGNDEMIIAGASLSAGAAAMPKVYSCINRNIGGGTEGQIQGPDNGVGLNTVGVLQTTWGRVSDLVTARSMTIDDGSGTPVKVIGPTGLASNGDYVRVTGIAGIEKQGGMHTRVLRTRTDADVLVETP